MITSLTKISTKQKLVQIFLKSAWAATISKNVR